MGGGGGRGEEQGGGGGGWAEPVRRAIFWVNSRSWVLAYVVK